MSRGACLVTEFCEGRTCAARVVPALVDRISAEISDVRLSPEAILVNLERLNLRFQRGPRDP
jgi:hypothetical protein